MKKIKELFYDIIIFITLIFSRKHSKKLFQYFYPKTNTQLIDFFLIDLQRVIKCYIASYKFYIPICCLFLIYLAMSDRLIITTNNVFFFISFFFIVPNVITQLRINKYYFSSSENIKNIFRTIYLIIYLIGFAFSFFGIFQKI